MSILKDGANQQHKKDFKITQQIYNNYNIYYKIASFLLLFSLILYKFYSFNLSNSTTAPCVIETKPRENPLVVWVKHPQHSDAVKVYVPQNADVHDVKKYVRQELAPALDKEGLGKVLLLSQTRGKLAPDTPIKNILDKQEQLIVFVDNIDSRLHLKMLTTEQVPLQVNAPLCLKSDEAYIVLAKILLSMNSAKDIIAFKESLCDSSIESWSSRYSYTFKDGRSNQERYKSKMKG